MSKKESKEIKKRGCIETGCPNKATKKIKTPDGQKIHLCEEHYIKWGGGEGSGRKSRRLAKIWKLFRRKK